MVFKGVECWWLYKVCGRVVIVVIKCVEWGGGVIKCTEGGGNQVCGDDGGIQSCRVVVVVLKCVDG